MDILIIGFIALVIVAVMLIVWEIYVMLMSEYDRGEDKDEREDD